MNVVVVDYNAGNKSSVLNALKRIGIQPEVTQCKESIARADKVLVPGVGEAGSTMERLRASGLDTLIPVLTQPVLGICVGLQILTTWSEESDTTCLGVLRERCLKFRVDQKVPQIGWNQVTGYGDHVLFKGIPEGEYFYFVHSYYVEVGSSTIATANHGIDFSAAIHQDNFMAVQFHPEKSGKVGSRLLQNFLEI